MDKKELKHNEYRKILDSIIKMSKSDCLTPEEEDYLQKVYIKIFEYFY